MTAPTTVRIDGAALRRRRMAAGVSIRYFAYAIGISRPYLSMIETGQRPRVSPRVYRRLRRMLDVVGEPCDLLPVEPDESAA